MTLKFVVLLAYFSEFFFSFFLAYSFQSPFVLDIFETVNYYVCHMSGNSNQQQVGFDAITFKGKLPRCTMSSIILRNRPAAYPAWGSSASFFLVILHSILFFPTNLPFHFNVKHGFVSRVNFAYSLFIKWRVCACVSAVYFFHCFGFCRWYSVANATYVVTDDV